MDILTDAMLDKAEILNDPSALWDRLRAMGMARTQNGLVMVGGYKECQAVLTDADRFRQPHYPLDGPAFPLMNPPEHGRLRGLVSQAFTPRSLRRWTDEARSQAEGLLAGVAAKGSGDLVDMIARPLPGIIIRSMLGITDVERAQWSSEWSAAITQAFSMPTLTAAQIAEAAPFYRRAMEASQHEIAFFREVIDARAPGGEDIIALLLAAQAGGDRLTKEELLFTLVALLEGGENTSINLIGSAALLLLQHPDQLDVARADPDLIPGAVDEALRYRPVNQVIRRLVHQDTELAGETLRAGETVIVCVAAANRDPAIFADPDRYDIRRSNAQRHLSLGAGIHFCLGAALVRQEARIALEAILSMLPELRLSPTGASMNGCFNDRGPASVPVEWTQGEAA